MKWFDKNHRPLPWKGERNPYLVWLSEIILQQTRVEQGLPYFEKFKEKYPTVQDLAKAPEDEVMKLWEGLGYYSRAKNLHHAAKFIAGELGGIFPKNYTGIRSLKGVGDYTAAAIASFAFDLPHAVVDGNVHRVLARYFGIGEPTNTTSGKKLFSELAQNILATAIAAQSPISSIRPGSYNQAIMDFGATQCTPAAPKCPACPLRLHCDAFQKGMVEKLPVKSRKPERRTRFFNYLIINRQGDVFIKKRTGRDIWRNLYEFPLIETETLVEDRQTMLESQAWKQCLGENFHLKKVSPPMRQELTHQKIVALFWEIEVDEDFCPPDAAWVKVQRSRLGDFAFPKIIGLYFREKFLPLELF